MSYTKVNGEILRRLRKKKQLTLKQVSAVIGCAYTYLSRLESGQFKNPGIDSIRQLADLYEVPLSTLIQQEQGQGENSHYSVDLVKELYVANTLIHNGNEIPLSNEMRERIEVALEMGILYAKQLIKEEDEQ